LAEYVIGNLPPWEILPKGHGKGDGWVEVATGHRRAGDDCKGNAKRKGKANLQYAAECCDTKPVFLVEGVTSNGRYAAKYEAEYACSLCNALS
jgi:hypothetical protein